MMKKEEIVVFGASEHAKYTIDILEKQNLYKILGIIDIKLQKGTTYAGYKVLSNFEDFPQFVEEFNVKKGIIAIGDNFTRYKKAERIKTLVPDFSFATAIHPNAVIGKNVVIGQGVLIMAGVIISNDSTVGDHCFIASRSLLSHDSTMSDCSSLSPGVTMGGNISLGTCSIIGMGAIILQRIRIGNHSVIGSGALVLKDIPDNTVAYGAPAKVIKTRENTDKYL
mgnify:CR=1 FL=1